MARALLFDPLQRFKAYSQVLRATRRTFTGSISVVKFLASAPTIESIPNYGGYPEIIMIGRANVGKSSLVNYVCSKKDMAITSSTPGRTRALNFYCLRKTKGNLFAILVDSPGYGSRGRPEWGALFDHYIKTRKELRSVYILINAEHGVTEDDKAMLRFLERESRQKPTPFKVQAVLTKVDKVPMPLRSRVVEAHQRVISEVSSSCLPPILTAVGRVKFGKVALGQSILRAWGLA